jgi:hypothetical protein
MDCPASDRWQAAVMPEDPADWPPGTDGLVATMLRQQKAESTHEPERSDA